MTTAHVHLDGRKLASLALIPFSLILIVLFTALDIRIATEPPFLLAFLNTIFIGIIPLVIAAIAFRSYRTGGSTGLFMMGSGMMIFGLGSIAAGWLIGFPGGANISVTIYNVCTLLSAVFFLTGALLTFTPSKKPETTGYAGKIAAAATGIIVFVAVFIGLTIAGLIPPFFIAGFGPTVLRQVVLSLAIAFLAIASILLFHEYQQKREDFFFWYSVSLAVIAVGLVAAIFIPALGSPVNWVSRVMQYIGAGFALVAIIVAGRLARDRGHSLEETLSRFFSNAEAGYKSLIETATDAIVVFDAADRVLVWNQAAEQMFGYSSREAIGSSFFALAIPDESAGVIRNKFTVPATADPDPDAHKSVEITARKKDGSRFPAGLSLSRHMAAGTLVSTCIIRDLTERKKTEDALRESEERLRLAQEAGNVGIWDWDLLSGEVRWTRELEAIYGMKPGSVHTYQDFQDRVYPDDIGRLERMLSAAVDQHKPFDYEFRIRRPDGEVRWIFCRGGTLYNEEGRPVRQFGVNIDITGQKKAEAQVQDSYKTFSDLIEGAPFGIYVIDSQFRIAMMNIGSQNNAFRNVRPLIGRYFPEAMHTLWPDDVAEEILGHFRHTLETGEPYYSPRFTNPRHDIGLTESYEWELHRMTLPGGQYGVICYYFDSTKLRNAEEALRESEERFRTIANTVPVLVCVTRLSDSIVMFTNEVNNRAFGVRSEDVVGSKGPDYYCDPADRVKMIDLLREQGFVDNYILKVKKSDSTPFWIMTSVRPITFQGQPAIIGASIDITGQIQLEDELKRNVEKLTMSEEELKAALAEKEILLAEIHHRVKNNLTAFISLLSLEGSTEDTPAGKMLKQDLQNRARSMALIHETLYKTHQFSEVDMDAYLTPLVNQVVISYSSAQSIRTIIEAKGVALDLSRATPAGLIVNELVTNSLKHAFPKEAIACRADQKDPCTIRIRLTKENGSYQLSVYDNGIGMPAGFDPLTAKSLGLKLVNFLAKHQMRATIEVNTVKGTEFVFRFRERDHGA